MAAPTIPIVVNEDAAARVAELGMQRELEQMLEHARQVVPDLRALRVTLEHDPARPEDEPQVVLWAYRDKPRPEDLSSDRTDSDYAAWKIRTFPPEVCAHFVMLSVYGAADGR
jgi:hypothetical protein